MHKQTILKMCQAAHMEYAKSEDAADPSWFIWNTYPRGNMPFWVPEWANCTEPQALYDWMRAQFASNIYVRKAMKEAGMRVSSLNISKKGAMP